jgi:hypothetical protein
MRSPHHHQTRLVVCQEGFRSQACMRRHCVRHERSTLRASQEANMLNCRMSCLLELRPCWRKECCTACTAPPLYIPTFCNNSNSPHLLCFCLPSRLSNQLKSLSKRQLHNYVHDDKRDVPSPISQTTTSLHARRY